MKRFVYSQQLTKTGRKVLNRLKRPLSSLVLSLGLALAGASDLQVHATEVMSLTSRPDSPTTLISNTQIASTVQSSAASSSNGVYLYGQSPEPNQIGYAYAIMEIVDGQAVGAFYMPQSSFDCFYGEVQSEMLALNVVSSYEQAAYQYSLPLDTPAVAAASPNVQPMQLSGYHDIEAVSSNDHRILDICRSVVQNVR